MLYIYVTLLLCFCTTTYVSHGHVVHGKERVEDGNLSPRGTRHYEKEDDEDTHNANFDYESILGSTKLIEEYEAMTEVEAKSSLSKLVQKMDGNQDGFVDKTELSSWITNAYKTLDGEESAERFEEADDNADGTISWAEHLVESYGIHSEEEMPDESDDEYEDTMQFIREDKLAWEKADQDEDKQLNVKEYFAFSHPEHEAHMQDFIIMRTLWEKDKNNDKIISMDEYLETAKSQVDHESLSGEKERFVKEYDLNNDGKLEGEEILRWQSPRGGEHDEAEHLINLSDSNKDKKLSLDEILEHYHMFVPSADLESDDDDDDHDEL